MSRLRVLLVDDEEELVTSLEERLAIRGIEARAATNGREALDLMARLPFDVVVVDLKMPGLGGEEVVDAVHRTHPDVKVIMVTGHGSDPAASRRAADRQVQVLLKPFSLEALLKAMGVPSSSAEGRS